MFARYFPVMCVFANHIVHDKEIAKDLTQDVFIKIWDSKLDLIDEVSVRSYLYICTKNNCLTYLKKEKRNTILDYEHHEIPSEKTMDDQIVVEETYRLLEEAMRTLGDKTRNIIQLSMAGKGHKEIAEELDISVNTIKTLKLRAYRALREKLNPQILALVKSLLF